MSEQKKFSKENIQRLDIAKVYEENHELKASEQSRELKESLLTIAKEITDLAKEVHEEMIEGGKKWFPSHWVLTTPIANVHQIGYQHIIYRVEKDERESYNQLWLEHDFFTVDNVKEFLQEQMKEEQNDWLFEQQWRNDDFVCAKSIISTLRPDLSLANMPKEVIDKIVDTVWYITFVDGYRKEDDVDYSGADTITDTKYDNAKIATALTLPKLDMSKIPDYYVERMYDNLEKLEQLPISTEKVTSEENDAFKYERKPAPIRGYYEP